MQNDTVDLKPIVQVDTISMLLDMTRQVRCRLNDHNQWQLRGQEKDDIVAQLRDLESFALEASLWVE
jgi:hypothetical protein